MVSNCIVSSFDAQKSASWSSVMTYIHNLLPSDWCNITLICLYNYVPVLLVKVSIDPFFDKVYKNTWSGDETSPSGTALQYDVCMSVCSHIL